jgi:hypothetical protein
VNRYAEREGSVRGGGSRHPAGPRTQTKGPNVRCVTGAGPPLRTRTRHAQTGAWTRPRGVVAVDMRRAAAREKIGARTRGVPSSYRSLRTRTWQPPGASVAKSTRNSGKRGQRRLTAVPSASTETHLDEGRPTTRPAVKHRASLMRTTSRRRAPTSLRSPAKSHPPQPSPAPCPQLFHFEQVVAGHGNHRTRLVVGERPRPSHHLLERRRRGGPRLRRPGTGRTRQAQPALRRRKPRRGMGLDSQQRDERQSRVGSSGYRGPPMLQVRWAASVDRGCRSRLPARGAASRLGPAGRRAAVAG